MDQPRHVTLGDSKLTRTLFIAPHKPIQPVTGEVSAGCSLNQFVRRLAFRKRSLGDCGQQVFR